MKVKLLLLFFLAASFLFTSAQIKIGDQPTVQQKSVALDVKGSNGKQGLWLPRVSDTTDATGIDGLTPPDGLLIYHTPSQNLMVRINGAWVPLIETDTTINNIYVNGTTKVTGPDVKLKVGNSPGTTNDFNLVGSTSLKDITINLPDASTTARGAITTGAQTLAGAKTFANGITVNNGSTLNNGTTANNGLTVSGATGNASSLTLGINSSTTTTNVGSSTLTVDASGKVFLSSTNIEANKPSRVLNYTLTITGSSLAANSTFTVNAPLPATANVSFPASVFISPTTALSTGTTIDWATILNNNLVANISTRANPQNLNNYVFYVTIVDF